jgi:hypothetical protein
VIPLEEQEVKRTGENCKWLLAIFSRLRQQQHQVYVSTLAQENREPVATNSFISTFKQSSLINPPRRERAAEEITTRKWS